MNSKIEIFSQSCPICKFKDETIEHALIHCDRVRVSWIQSSLGLQSHYIPIGGIEDWWKKNFDVPSPLCIMMMRLSP